LSRKILKPRGDKMSKYTEHIESILRQSPYTFRKEVQFIDLRWKLPLRFDYALYQGGEMACLLEVDGEQHFEAIAAWGGRRAFIKTQELDRKKNRYSLSVRVPLYRIPYNKIYSIVYYGSIFSDEFLVKTQWHNDNVRKNLEKL
jgi:hypothetical protein